VLTVLLRPEAQRHSSPQPRHKNLKTFKRISTMNIVKKTLTASLLALSIGNAFAAETSGVEHNTQAFLNALAAGGGKPLEN
jgi:hypothetical protein